MALFNTYVSDNTIHRVSWQQETDVRNKKGGSQSQNGSQLIKNQAVGKFTAILRNELHSRDVSELSE